MMISKRFKIISTFGVLAIACSLIGCGGKKVNYHTVTWQNDDNSLIYKDEKVADGQTPAFTGETPSKVSDDPNFYYTFKGWTPEISAVKGDVTYTAIYETGINYTVSENSDGTYAIDDCLLTDATSLSIPTSYNNKAVTVLKENAFAKCTKAETIVVPSSIQELKPGCFADTSKLKNLTVPFLCQTREEAKNFRYLFDTNGEQYPMNLENVVLASGCTNIPDEAFRFCYFLTVSIPKTVNYIGNLSFAGCDSLESVNYEGTKVEWGNITKSFNVLGDLQHVVKVHCSDGDVNF